MSKANPSLSHCYSFILLPLKDASYVQELKLRAFPDSCSSFILSNLLCFPSLISSHQCLNSHFLCVPIVNAPYSMSPFSVTYSLAICCQCIFVISSLSLKFFISSQSLINCQLLNIKISVLHCLTSADLLSHIPIKLFSSSNPMIMQCSLLCTVYSLKTKCG